MDNFIYIFNILKRYRISVVNKGSVQDTETSLGYFKQEETGD